MEEVFLILDLSINEGILAQFKCISSILQSYGCCFGHCWKDSGSKYNKPRLNDLTLAFTLGPFKHISIAYFRNIGCVLFHHNQKVITFPKMNEC